MSQAVALSHPNIALSKYWGKRQGPGNIPAVPSLSVTLEGLSTRTLVRWQPGTRADHFVLDGRPRSPEEAPKVYAFLEELRRALGVDSGAYVESTNDFPTASGLASSASGFAALALAGAHAAGRDWEAPAIADLARRGSASAARSLFGGFVELEDGVARPLASSDHLPMVVFVCVTTEEPKAMSSSAAMRWTLDRSPYARAWLEHAPTLHARLRAALLARDFDAVGELAESSALAMHAAIIAAGVVYWNGITLEALGAVRALRDSGVRAYATIDAGPHVKVITRPGDAPAVRSALDRVPGVLRIIEAHPGPGARIVLEGEGVE